MNTNGLSFILIYMVFSKSIIINQAAYIMWKSTIYHRKQINKESSAPENFAVDISLGWIWNLNSGPHTCKGGSLPLELYLHTPFCQTYFGYFGDGGPMNYFPGWLSTVTLLILVFQVHVTCMSTISLLLWTFEQFLTIHDLSKLIILLKFCLNKFYFSG
jgi:hypothetical protein